MLQRFVWLGLLSLLGFGTLLTMAVLAQAQTFTPPVGTQLVGFVDASANLPPARHVGRSMEARAADVDADGDLDLLLAKEWARNELLLNDGTGVFTNATTTHLPNTVHDSEDIVLGDFDNDNDLDVVFSSEDDLVQEYWHNDGQGHFSPAQGLPYATANAVIAGDVDGDADLDLVFGAAGQELLLINDGAGMFSDQTAERLPAVDDVTQDVLLGDVDGDSDLDLVVGNEGDNRLLLNDGTGVFTATSKLPLTKDFEETRNLALADLDNDNDLDLFIANVRFIQSANAQDRILLNDGKGGFTDATSGRYPRETWYTMDGDFADLDHDGDLDLVTSYVPASLYRVYLNDGTANFTDATGQLFPNGFGAASIEVEIADFNADGWQDIYFANAEGPDRLLLAQPSATVLLPLLTR